LKAVGSPGQHTNFGDSLPEIMRFYNKQDEGEDSEDKKPYDKSMELNFRYYAFGICLHSILNEKISRSISDRLDCLCWAFPI
jgi:hypothetical protein